MNLTMLLDIFQHLPDYIAHWTDVMGPWIYVLLFCIIFAETGLVFTPILPGDSLLFAAGALTAGQGTLQLLILWPVLTAAAIVGDLTNYLIGKNWGLRLFRNPKSKLFNQKYLVRAETFYAHHGGKTVVLARFLPIIRTYVPFVSGLSRMAFSRYLPFNIAGAFSWITLFLLAGHWFGRLPVVKTRFHYVILAIVLISAAPAMIEYWRARKKN